MKYLYFKDPNPLSVATISPDWWRHQHLTDGPDTWHGDWSKAPSFFASKEDIGGLFIYAGGGDDTVHAGFGNDVVWGGSENDRLFGEGGNDTLYGEKGFDLLDGGLGADVMYGGNDNDTYIVDNSGDRVIEAVNDGIDMVQSSLFFYALPPEVENLHLAGSAVEGHGNGDRNIIDVIIGGHDIDLLTGDTGTDTFRWFSTSETGVGFSNTRDEIKDFNRLVDFDVIDLTFIDANEIIAGNQDFVSIGEVGRNGLTAPGQVGFFRDANLNFIIQLNTDNDPQAEAEITVLFTGQQGQVMNSADFADWFL